MNAQHSALNPAWGTPALWIERVREVLGAIDLDPASSEEHNQIVGARHFYTEKENALVREWIAGRVFLNPPGGRGVPQQFFQKLLAHWHKGDITEFIYLGYSLEQLLWVGRHGLAMSMALAIPHKRIKFRGNGDSPTHGNFFLYGGPFTQRFVTAFSRDCLVLSPARVVA